NDPRRQSLFSRNAWFRRVGGWPHTPGNSRPPPAPKGRTVMRTIRSALCTLVAGLALCPAAAPALAGPSKGAPTASRPAPHKKWKGKATALCQCKEGQCRPVECFVSGKFSYQAAQSALKFELEAKARGMNGSLKPESINFSIEVEF